jgi:lysophospholipase
MIAIAGDSWAPRARARLCGILGGLGARLHACATAATGRWARPFDGNPITSDPERYQRRRAGAARARPRLADIAWLRAALRSIAKLTVPDYPLKVEVPLLLFAAGKDTIVATSAIEEFALRLKVGTHLLFPQSRHEILQETDEIRQRFWAAFDAYLGVTATAA